MNNLKHSSEVTVYLVSRLGSERVKDKIYREFYNGCSLFEIMCQKMKDLSFPYAAAIGDKELINIAEKYNVPIQLRSKKALRGQQGTLLRDIYNFLEKCSTKYACLLSPCTPFLKIETVNQACNLVANTDTMSLSSVYFEQNWFFGSDKKPLFPIDVARMDSKALSLYGKANAFEIFPVKRFLEKGYYFNYESSKDPYLFEIDREEAIDINSEAEYKMASYSWKAKHEG
jgi:CMP-N-acetylneuraminic acid synthetase